MSAMSDKSLSGFLQSAPVRTETVDKSSRKPVASSLRLKGVSAEVICLDHPT